MKKLLLTLSILELTASTAHANPYFGADWVEKDKVGIPEYHDVYGLYYGYNWNSNITTEGRMEDEIVKNSAPNAGTTKQEGLFQGKVTYNPTSFFGVTPYVAGAVGYKSKATIEFPFYVAEAGIKYKLPVANDKIEIKLASRLRSPFNEWNEHTGIDLYRTVENSAQVGYNLTSKTVFFAKYAQERGDSNYNTYGFGLTHKF